MSLLIAGVVLWSILHLVPAIARPLRQTMIDRVGEKAYRGLFSLSMLLTLSMIVFGWRSTHDVYLYQLPVWTRQAGALLMIVAFILFGAAQYPTAIKRIVRHPMLTAVVVWSVSHLLTNGSTRAMVLFGGMGIWALLEIILINRREGAWRKPESPGIAREIRGIVISLLIFCVAFYLHKYYAGVPLIISPVLD